ncbi:TPA: hypothetical protein ACGSHR_002905 [Escherichia coli]|uniref:hypothetical protein n=1 Tax=Escherichia coli TaxID=562 RepID=UPI0013316482|nr:hypothetical protein [Escherichia coli]
MGNFLSFIGILVSIASCYYAYKAFISSKEISFPKKKPRENICVLKNFSKEANDFESFLSANIHRKVYLSIELDGNEFHLEETDDSKWLVIWTDKIGDVPLEEEPSTRTCSGFQLTITPHEDGFGHVYWYRGSYRISGHFYIEGFLGPYQGLMSAVISAAKTM